MLAGNDRVVDDFEAGGLPTFVLVDANGIVRLRKVGYGPELEPELEGALQQPSGAPGHSVYRVGGDVSAPTLVYRREPEFSEEARRAGVSGCGHGRFGCIASRCAN